MHFSCPRPTGISTDFMEQHAAMTSDLTRLRETADSAYAAANAAAALSPARGTPEWDRLVVLEEEAELASEAFVAAVLAEIDSNCIDPTTDVKDSNRRIESAGKSEVPS